MNRKFGQAIALNVAGIKCDTGWCNWRDESVKVIDYDKWLNRPCPVCGSNLLTPEDMASVKTMQGIVAFINLCAFPFMVIYDSVMRIAGVPSKSVKFSADMNGSGEIKFKPQKLDNGWELCPTCQSFHPADQKCMPPRRNW